MGLREPLSGKPAKRRERSSELTTRFWLPALLLASFALAPTPLAAGGSASTLAIDLHGPWRFRTGDDPSWASPELDDSAWQVLQFAGWGAQGYADYKDVAWYRHTFVLPLAEGEERRPAVLLGKISTAYEVYADGERLGGVGSLPPFPESDYDRHALYRIPARLLEDGRVLLALRIWAGPDIENTGGGPFEGPFFVGDERLLHEILVGEEMPRRFFSVAFLVVALFHLYLFRKWRASSPYLWFGLLTLATGGYIFLRSQWKYDLGIGFATLKEIEFLLVMSSPAIAAQFFWSLFDQKMPRILRVYQIATVAAGIVVAATPGLGLNLAILDPWLAVLAPVCLWMVAFLVREAWRGRPEAQGMVLGFSVLVATVLHDMAAEQGWIPPSRWLPWGFAAFLLSMALVLAERFRRIHGEVELLRDDLQSQVLQQTAALMARTEEAQQASLAKSRFLATVSHELRSPLNSIIGFAEILRRHTGPERHPRQEDFLDHIAGSGQHLLGLINDILDLSKIEAGKMKPALENTNLEEVIRGVCDICQGVAAPNDIQIQQELPEELPRLWTDPVMVKQILWNLLSNAVKFSPRGGEVWIRAALGNGHPDGGEPDVVRLAIEDRGIGIAEEDHERIFQEFQQLDGDNDRRYQGTGLGLALVRRLTELLGGEVALESRLQEGSVFHVVLPLRSTELGEVP